MWGPGGRGAPLPSAGSTLPPGKQISPACARSPTLRTQNSTAGCPRARGAHQKQERRSRCVLNKPISTCFVGTGMGWAGATHPAVGVDAEWHQHRRRARVGRCRSGFDAHSARGCCLEALRHGVERGAVDELVPAGSLVAAPTRAIDTSWAACAVTSVRDVCRGHAGSPCHTAADQRRSRRAMQCQCHAAGYLHTLAHGGSRGVHQECAACRSRTRRNTARLSASSSAKARRGGASVFA